VRVKVSYHSEDRRASDTALLVDVWRLPDAGLEIDEMRAPAPCLAYIAAAWFGEDPGRALRAGYVIDTAGYAGASLSQHQVDNSTLGQLVTEVATGQMHSGDRRRLRRAEKDAADAGDIFDSAFAEYVLEDLTQNRLGASALPVEWALWVGLPSDTNLPFAQSTPIAESEPPKQFAMGTKISRTLSLDEYGSGKPDDRRSNLQSEEAPKWIIDDAGWDKAPDGTERSKEDIIQWLERSGQMDPTAEAVIRRHWGQHLLTERERDAVVKVELLGMTHREAGVEMGIAEGTVSKLISRARKKLEDDVQDPGPSQT
jgi:predicted DNA-binding protein (UPF0251 family)